jgi:hypothetical protein
MPSESLIKYDSIQQLIDEFLKESLKNPDYQSIKNFDFLNAYLINKYLIYEQNS